MRWSILAIEAWAIISMLLTFVAASRALFDPEPAAELELTKLQLFFIRLFVSAFWPLMLFSASGRKALHYLVEGEAYFNEEDPK